MSNSEDMENGGEICWADLLTMTAENSMAVSYCVTFPYCGNSDAEEDACETCETSHALYVQNTSLTTHREHIGIVWSHFGVEATHGTHNLADSCFRGGHVCGL